MVQTVLVSLILPFFFYAAFLFTTTTLLTGSRDDVSLPPDEAIDKADYAKGVSSKNPEYLPHERQMHVYGSNVTMENNENHQMSAENKYRIPGIDFYYLLVLPKFVYETFRFQVFNMG